MESPGTLRVEVVYACAARQYLVSVDLPAGSVAGDALERSGLRTRFPETTRCQLGIHGQTVDPNEKLRDGDRVEIYRPLVADPKVARRERALRTTRRRPRR